MEMSLDLHSPGIMSSQDGRTYRVTCQSCDVEVKRVEVWEDWSELFCDDRRVAVIPSSRQIRIYPCNHSQGFTVQQVYKQSDGTYSVIRDEGIRALVDLVKELEAQEGRES